LIQGVFGSFEGLQRLYGVLDGMARNMGALKGNANTFAFGDAGTELDDLFDLI
jgi:hypothetical protein